MWSTFSIRYNRKKNTRTWHIFDRQHPKEPPQDIAHFRATGGHPWPCPLPNDRPSCPWPSTGCKAGGKKWRSSGATMGSHTKFAPVILSIFNFKRHSVHWICIHVSYIYIYIIILSHTIPLYHYFLAHHWKNTAGGPHLFALPLPSWKVRRIASSQDVPGVPPATGEAPSSHSWFFIIYT